MKQLFLGLASLPALAQSLEVLPPAPPPDLTFRVGGRVDSNHGSDLQGRLTWNPSRASTLFLSGTRSTLASTTEAPSPDGNTTTTTTTTLGGGHAFGAFYLGLQGDHSAMSGLLSSNRVTLQPALEGSAWRFGLELSARKTDFDRLQFRNITIPTLNGPVIVTGYADLDLSDTGLGGSLDYFSGDWRFYATYTHFAYGSFEGTTDVSRIRDGNGRVGIDIFKALSGRLTSRLQQLSASRLSRRAALLDSTAGLGFEADLTRSRWALDLGEDVDHLTGDAAHTYTGVAAWKATRTFTVELQLGAVQSEALGTDRFAGLALIIRTRPEPRRASLWDLLALLD